MKKLFSILFAALILLSGMHLTLATHLCGGEVSAVKLSFIHEKASCGMCEEQTATANTAVSTEGCCKDEMSFYAVDSNY
ncbi:MAG: HYC_CC_PP family protein, partial [Paludibacter sp.]